MTGIDARISLRDEKRTPRFLHDLIVCEPHAQSVPSRFRFHPK
jgi:hypothetical protein